LGVVAHELGHWANGDFIKNITFALFKIYTIFFVFSYSLRDTNMPFSFGFTQQTSSLKSSNPETEY